MKKIIHMTPPEINNGVYKYIFNHFPYMDRNVYEFGFLTRGYEQLIGSDEYKKYGFCIHPFNATQRNDPSALREQVKKVLFEYDAIHLHTSSWRGFMIEEIAMELGMEKVIVHSHSTGIDIEDTTEREHQIREHMKFREVFSDKYATDFCACSYEAADWLFGENIPKKSINIMPNAIDTCKYKFNNKKRNFIREKYGLEGKFVLGHVGRYSYTKNQSFLINLLYELRKKDDRFCLVCIGQGELKEQYNRLIKDLKLENVVFLLDWTEAVDYYLQAFDMFVLPSIFEGFPISVIEAQAAGLPCLISDSVTDSVKITELVIKLERRIDLWKDEIVRISGLPINDRDLFDVEVKNAGYDIEDSAKRWVQLYN